MYKILINEPVPFYSYLDEKFFFLQLHDIDGVVSVERNSLGLDVIFEPSITEGGFWDLAALMTRYNLNLKLLSALGDDADNIWLHTNKKAYWYKHVFPAKWVKSLFGYF
jgi:hypothetical protein